MGYNFSRDQLTLFCLMNTEYILYANKSSYKSVFLFIGQLSKNVYMNLKMKTHSKVM